MDKQHKKVSILRKIRTILLCMAVSAGVVYFFDTLTHFTSAKASQLLWIVLFGVAFAWFINFDLDKISKK